MEPTRAQRNSSLISEMKGIREDVAKLRYRIEQNSGHREAAIMLTLLQRVDHHAIDRLVELGLELKLEDSNQR